MELVISALVMLQFPSLPLAKATCSYVSDQYQNIRLFNRQISNTSLLTNLAAAEGELSNYTGALSLYKKTLSIDSKDIGAFVGIGLSLKHLGNNSTAMKYFKEAVAQPITNSNDSRFVKVDGTSQGYLLIEELCYPVFLSLVLWLT